MIWLNLYLVGGFNHLEKHENQWEGLFHILWKIKAMFQTTNQLTYINQLYTMRSYETMEHRKINVYIPLNGKPTQWFPMLIVSHEKLFISFYHIPVSKYNSCPLTLRLILLIQFKHCITNPKSVNISC